MDFSAEVKKRRDNRGSCQEVADSIALGFNGVDLCYLTGEPGTYVSALIFAYFCSDQWIDIARSP